MVSNPKFSAVGRLLSVVRREELCSNYFSGRVPSSARRGWTALKEHKRYLIRDRDAAYGEVFIRRIQSMGIRDRPTSPRSPWQNGYAERLIGSIRRECVDHVVVF